MEWICSGLPDCQHWSNGNGYEKVRGNGVHHSFEDAGLFARLDGELWPSLRAQLAEMVHASIDYEVTAARDMLRDEHAELMASLDKREAALSAAQREVQKAREAVFAERRSLEAEKERYVGSAGTSDVLRLNIGGERTVSVQRGTLCAVSDSKLASTFGGRWDGSLPRDKDGAFFVDFDPDLFLPLLAYLRMKRIQDTAAPLTPQTLPTVVGREAEFMQMLKFYGIIGGGEKGTAYDPASSVQFRERGKAYDPASSVQFREKGPEKGPVELSFLWARRTVPHVSISPDGMTVTRTGHPHWRRAFGDKIVNRTLLESSLRASFRIVSLGSPPDSKDSGPLLGFAEGGADRMDDCSAERNPQGMFTYRVRDGRLLAPSTRTISGANPRSRAHVGDVLTFIIHADGQIGFEKNGKSGGIIFKNVPDCLMPVVEMNTENCRVEIVTP